MVLGLCYLLFEFGFDIAEIFDHEVCITMNFPMCITPWSQILGLVNPPLFVHYNHVHK